MSLVSEWSYDKMIWTIVLLNNNIYRHISIDRLVACIHTPAVQRPKANNKCIGSLLEIVYTLPLT